MNVDAIRKTAGSAIALPLVRALARTGVTPNAVSWTGFVITAIAAYLVGTGYLIAGGVVVLVGSFLDMLDGALARVTNRVTASGGVLDSTLDRLSEAVLFLGILALFLWAPGSSGHFALLTREWSVILVFVTLISSQMVSYIRSRAETAGMECKVGIFTRSERVIVLVLGLVLQQVVIALAVIALFSLITMAQRMAHAAKG